MPLTPAHVAAVLPAGRWTSGRPGWTAAVVAGSMAPDLPYFLPSALRDASPVDLSRVATHSLPALPTTAAVLGLLAALLWDRAFEPVVRDALPRPVAGRLGSTGPRASWRDLPTLYLWAVAGVATHDLWDSFTHASGPVTERVGWLRSEVAGVPVWSWLQLASSAVGLLAVVGWAVVVVRGRPVRPVARVAGWLPAAGAAIGVLALAAGTWSAWRHRDEPLIDVIAWFGVTRAGGAAALGLAVVCILWWVVAGRGSRARTP